jgi:hypothetical protein
VKIRSIVGDGQLPGLQRGYGLGYFCHDESRCQQGTRCRWGSELSPVVGYTQFSALADRWAVR